jgi:DNA-binding NarL/FixJ family response regulator
MCVQARRVAADREPGARRPDACRPATVARSATEARQVALARARWGGFIVDPGLPEGSSAGVELLAWLRARDPSAARVLVTGQPLETLAEAGTALGASLVASIRSRPAQLAA